MSAKDTKHSAASSDFPEDSQNLLPSGECEIDKGEANVSLVIVTVNVRLRSANSENFLQTRRWRWSVQKAHRRSITLGMCASASPANICRIYWEVLVKMYQFQVFHGLKACHKLLV